jgi:hypothetical protein
VPRIAPIGLQIRWQIAIYLAPLWNRTLTSILRAVAPVIVRDYFPNQSPQDLAKKTNLCQGAKPQIHAHFFASDGKFGSIDQHGFRKRRNPRRSRDFV